MKLLFLGSPGVGKGTYAQILKEALNIPHISTGDLLRDEVKKGTPLGHELDNIMKSGGLINDDMMIKIIEERIKEEDCKNGFILDGFPRTKNQAEQLNELLEITKVLNFKADDEVIIERLSGRLTCTNCKTIFHKTGNKPKKEGKCDHCDTDLITREDDKAESVKNRLDIYKEKTAPLIDHYKDQRLLVEIVINKPISEIREKVVTNVKDFLEGKTDSIKEIN